MTDVLTKEHIIETLEARSIILGPPGRPEDPPRMSSTRFLDEAGLRGLLNDLTRQDEDVDRGPRGFIRTAEDAVKEAVRCWKDFDSCQVPPRGEPQGRFAEDLNRAEARLEVYKREAAKITEVLAEIDAKRKTSEEKVRSRTPLRRGGCCTSRDGEIIEVDGQEVRKGKLDTGEPLEGYLERVNEAKRTWAHSQH